MINSLLVKLATGDAITDLDLQKALRDVCEELHACDCDECPVYAARNGDINPSNGPCGCETFKDGKAMLAAIRAGSGGAE